MERIVIEVDETVARKWRLASQLLRNQLARQLNATLTDGLSSTKQDFIQFMDETGATMQARGLTEEALADILKADD